MFEPPAFFGLLVVMTLLTVVIDIGVLAFTFVVMAMNLAPYSAPPGTAGLDRSMVRALCS